MREKITITKLVFFSFRKLFFPSIVFMYRYRYYSLTQNTNSIKWKKNSKLNLSLQMNTIFSHLIFYTKSVKKMRLKNFHLFSFNTCIYCNWNIYKLICTFFVGLLLGRGGVFIRVVIFGVFCWGGGGWGGYLLMVIYCYYQQKLSSCSVCAVMHADTVLSFIQQQLVT